MSDFKKYEKEALDMFFISVKKDLNTWDSNGVKYYYSERVGDFYFSIDTSKDSNIVKLNRDGHCVLLSKYLKEPFNGFLGNVYYISNFKVWRYVNKVKKHIKLKSIDNSSDTLFLKTGLEKLNKKYISVKRKEKLKKIG